MAKDGTFNLVSLVRETHCPPGLAIAEGGEENFAIFKLTGWHPLLGKRREGHNRLIVDTELSEDSGMPVLVRAKGVYVVQEFCVSRRGGEVIRRPQQHEGVIVGTYREEATPGRA